MKTSFWRQGSFVVFCAALTIVGLLPQIVSAGTCMKFCSRRVTTGLLTGESAYTEVVAQPGGSCTAAAQCPTIPPTPCDAGYDRATVSDADIFCRLITPIGTPTAPNPYHHLTAGLSWCSDLLNPGRAFQTDVELPPDGECFLSSAEVATRLRASRPAEVLPEVNGPSRPTVSDTPIPAPVHPGEGFRCRFLCSSDTSSRDGQACSAMTDTDTCMTQCNTTCRGAGQTCLGATGSNSASDQSPRCIPTRPPEASVAGLVDTQRFEAVNEAFANLSIPNFIGSLIKTLLGVAGALFFAMLIWGGVRWMTAGGDQGSVKSAKTITMNAVVGMIILVLSYTIVTAFMQIVAQFATRAP